MSCMIHKDEKEYGRKKRQATEHHDKIMNEISGYWYVIKQN